MMVVTREIMIFYHFLSILSMKKTTSCVYSVWKKTTSCVYSVWKRRRSACTQYTHDEPSGQKSVRPIDRL